MNAIYKNVLFLKLSRAKRTQKVPYYFRIFLSYYILVLLNQKKEKPALKNTKNNKRPRFIWEWTKVNVN